MAKQLAFHVDSSVCTKCKACQIACKDKNDLPIGVLWRRVYQYGGGGWVKSGNMLVPSNIFAYSISLSCNHCENPACMDVCPTMAISKDENGVVKIDQKKCIGCRYCEWACPYGAPQFNEEQGYMTKCNFCEDLIAKGENPVCVDACPMRAIHYGELKDLQAQYGTQNEFEPLPTSEITHPSLVVTPHKHAQVSGKGTGSILNMPEEI
ncbi:MAG: dimethylsulfoxide reductase subunit B [Chloroflexi bacterium]|nr:dimethylsulfoxide reductase subunit B [Chloroflexota bacterium]